MVDPITTEEAAKLLGISARRVLVLIKDGRLPARMIGKSRVYLIERADLEKIGERKPGRPKVVKPDAT